MNLVTLATCNLNQWALDFEGNLKRTAESIRLAKGQGARYRLGPELELTGYGCEDAFLEGDTIRHSWEVLAELLRGDLTDGILVDVGLPVMHHGVRYNCRALLLDRKILLLRPKVALADDGNYRESRWFAAWTPRLAVEDHVLPRIVQQVNGQRMAPIGDAAIATRDTVLASETCEELFTPDSPHIALSLDGAEIVANGSASHHELRKLQRRLDLIRAASSKGGGVYMYANQQGCDGGRLYFDGCAMIVVNGSVVAQGSQFSPADVEVVTATVDLETVRSFRGASASRMVQASQAQSVPRIRVDFELTDRHPRRISEPHPVRIHPPEEEIALGPAAWLWDYLRRSGASGFLLPLSGGADSAAVAALVGSMCQHVLAAAQAGEDPVASDLRRILGLGSEDPLPGRAADVAHAVLRTVYMATEHNADETRERAARIAADIGARHTEVDMDDVVASALAVFERATGHTPRFEVHGGEAVEDLAKQNVQARSRMVLAYLFGQLLPWSEDRSGGSSTEARDGSGSGSHGRLLVLGSSNVDESLRGYLTKYDPSSADLNPIGSISKLDLKSFLAWAAENLGYPSLRDVVDATPMAELAPPEEGAPKTDEREMGLTYVELSTFGRLRKIDRLGPVAMFERLTLEWDHLEVDDVAVKVKRFFRTYAANRHKMTTLTPAYHAESYSPDDNRFDLRPFLYDTSWTWQFRRIDRLVAEREAR